MCEPDRQVFHSDQRVDDPNIGPDDRLLRHLTVPFGVHQKHGKFKLSDQALKPRKNDPGISVDLECLLKEKGFGERDRRGLHPAAHALGAIAAADARRHSGGVAWTPKPEEIELTGYARAANDFHGEIIRPLAPKSYRELAAAMTILWVRPDTDLGNFEGQSPEISDAE
jgi:hypothetical protein